MPQKKNFTYSQNGLNLTEEFEGLRLTAYQDQVGVWTIGYGHTGSDVHAGLTITRDQANTLLMQDTASAAAAVNRLVTVALNQDEFDALVDFVFNLGQNAFAGSRLLRKLNAGDFVGAAAEFPKWDHAGGQVVPGLLRRREAEQQLFQRGVQQTATAAPAPPTTLGMAPAMVRPTGTAAVPTAAKKTAAPIPAPAKKVPVKTLGKKKTAIKTAAPKKATPAKRQVASKSTAKKTAAEKGALKKAAKKSSAKKKSARK